MLEIVRVECSPVKFVVNSCQIDRIVRATKVMASTAGPAQTMASSILSVVIEEPNRAFPAVKATLPAVLAATSRRVTCRDVPTSSAASRWQRLSRISACKSIDTMRATHRWSSAYFATVSCAERLYNFGIRHMACCSYKSVV